VPQSAVDRLFIATNVELSNQAENPDKQLVRFEFIELLIRIAAEKYRRTGRTQTHSEALQLLINDNVIPHSHHSEW